MRMIGRVCLDLIFSRFLNFWAPRATLRIHIYRFCSVLLSIVPSRGVLVSRVVPREGILLLIDFSDAGLATALCCGGRGACVVHLLL